MTNENVSDLSYADTLWKAADALRGQVDAAEYKHVDKGGRVNDEGRMKKRDRGFPRNSSFHIPISHFPRSGGMFVQSEKFAEAHGGNKTDVSIFGQESNPTTWRLAHMNLAIQSSEANLGSAPADTFLRDAHPDLKADVVLANPPFNVSDYSGPLLCGDKRWTFGDPPVGNANYAWIQHFIQSVRTLQL